jgi:hypothetical protein
MARGNDKANFMRLVVAAVEESNPGVSFVVSEPDFTIAGPNVTMSLNNVYRVWAQTSLLKRRAVVRQYVAGYRDAAARSGGRTTTKEEALALVMPVVRPRSYLELSLRQRTDDQKVASLAWKALSKHYVTLLVIDRPNSMAMVTIDELAEWGLSFDYLFTEGRKKLIAASSVSGFRQLSPGLFCSTYDNDYDTSLAFAPGLLRKLAIAGDPVIAPASRKTFLVCGDQDEQALQKMVEVASAAQESDPAPMSARLLRLDGFQWRHFMPPSESRAHPAARKAWYVAAQEEYREQCAHLETLFSRLGKDVFVGSLKLANKGNEVFSFTSWDPDAKDALIPMADLIFFARDAKGWVTSPFGVPTEAVLEICGHRLKEETMYPPRWSATMPPSAEEYDRLEQRQYSPS